MFKKRDVWSEGRSTKLDEGNAFFLLICHTFPANHVAVLDFFFLGVVAMVRLKESPIQVPVNIAS